MRRWGRRGGWRIFILRTTHTFSSLHQSGGALRGVFRDYYCIARLLFCAMYKKHYFIILHTIRQELRSSRGVFRDCCIVYI